MDEVNQTEKKKDFSLDSNSEEEDGSIVGMDIDVNFLDEKSSAVHCLGHLCIFLLRAFIELIERKQNGFQMRCRH